MKKTGKRRKGFTLIELIVVIAILAILAAIAVPNFIGLTKKANTATEIASAAQYATAMNVANALATDGDVKIIKVPTTDAELATLNLRLEDAGVLVTVDMTSAKLLSNVFARLTMAGEAFVVNPAKKGDAPDLDTPTTTTTAS